MAVSWFPPLPSQLNVPIPHPCSPRQTKYIHILCVLREMIWCHTFVSQHNQVSNKQVDFYQWLIGLMDQSKYFQVNLYKDVMETVLKKRICIILELKTYSICSFHLNCEYHEPFSKINIIYIWHQKSKLWNWHFLTDLSCWHNEFNTKSKAI